MLLGVFLVHQTVLLVHPNVLLGVLVVHPNVPPTVLLSVLPLHPTVLSTMLCLILCPTVCRSATTVPPASVSERATSVNCLLLRMMVDPSMGDSNHIFVEVHNSLPVQKWRVLWSV